MKRGAGKKGCSRGEKTPLPSKPEPNLGNEGSRASGGWGMKKRSNAGIFIAQKPVNRRKKKKKSVEGRGGFPI